MRKSAAGWAVRVPKEKGSRKKDEATEGERKKLLMRGAGDGSGRTGKRAAKKNRGR